MLLGGLWHGSSFNFIIWGAIHGLALSTEKMFFSKSYFLKWKIYFRPFNLLITFSIVLFSWIFFRSPDILTSKTIIYKILKYETTLPFVDHITIVITCFMALLIGLAFDFYLYKKNISLEEYGFHMSIKKIVLLITFIVMMIILFYSSSVNFIYFQF
jgi:alginate O-acetyltransferase complex protein AlgI